MAEGQPTGQLELPCREPGCEQKVVYRWQPLSGIAYVLAHVPFLTNAVTAYLTCPDGHVHRYRIGG